MHNRKGQKIKKGRGIHNKGSYQIVRPLKNYITQERKQLESLMYGLRTEFYIDVEKAKRAILEKIQETEHSIELIAQELSRRDSHYRKTDKKDVAS